VRYDALRSETDPSSASLVAKYGSWVRVCLYAHCLNLERDGASMPRAPWITNRPGGSKARYTREDVVSALQRCARELRRPPSKNAYHWWRAATHRRNRRAYYPGLMTIWRLYQERGGWVAGLEEAGLVEPPRMTVRVVVPTHDLAADLVARARDAGLNAAHVRRHSWIEVRGTITAVKTEILGCAGALEIENLTLWEPSTKTLERVSLT
jgi:hypothetical protein